MTPDTVLDTLEAPFRLEPGGWLTYREPVDGKLASLSAAELLAKSSNLSGTLRYARTMTGVLLIGECPIDPLDGGVQRTQDRLRAWASGPDRNDLPPDEEEVETLLDELFPRSSWQEDHWVLPADDAVAIERVACLLPGGVRVEAVLARWESQEPMHREALAEFLCRAQASLRLARLELHRTEARVVSQVETPFLASNLGHSLQGVAGACQALSQEVTALATTELARTYLDFLGKQEVAALCSGKT